MMPEEPSANRFPTTDWELLRQAEQQSELDLLILRYVPPIKTYLRVTRRLDAEQIEEAVQSFVSDRLIEKQLFTRADPARGRFRQLLVRTLENFLHDRHRWNMRRQPREGQLVPIGDGDASGLSYEDDPHAAFDHAWARMVLGEALRRTQAFFEGKSRPDIWSILEKRLVMPARANVPPVPYDQLAASHSFASPLEAANVLTTAKRRFQSILREVISEYEGPDANIDDELADLRKILARRA